MTSITHTITRFSVPAMLFETIEDAYGDMPALQSYDRGEFSVALNRDHCVEVWSVGPTDRLMALFFFDSRKDAGLAFNQLQVKSEDDIATILTNAGAMKAVEHHDPADAAADEAATL